jgi:hypothetical protein
LYAGQGIPALPIHDSLVFPKHDRETVRNVMEGEFLLQTGQPIAVEQRKHREVDA